MIYQKVLLTGAAGLLGSVLRKALVPRVALLRSADIVPMHDPAGNEELVQADLGDAAASQRLVMGMDAIVHFGGISKDEPFDAIARVNIIGVQALYEAALQAGIRRIVFASSVHAVGYYPQTDFIDTRAPTRPDSFYGVGKVFGEALAQFYWERHGLETVSIRIGSCEAVPSNRRHLRTWLSFGDLCQLVDRALTVPRVGHTIVFGTSDNAERFWDNRFASPLGYRPRDSADSYREAILADDPAPDTAEPLYRAQGGSWAP